MLPVDWVHCNMNVLQISFLLSVIRSGRISSVYIVGVGGLLVGHTFSKLVNFECVGMLKCVGVLECVRVLEC